MRSTRKTLLALIEQQPRRVRELVELTGMTACAVYGALNEFRALGIVRALAIPAVGRSGARKLYALPGATLHADALW